MSLSTVHEVIKRVMDFLVDLSPSVIQFPATEAEREIKAAEFRRITSIDGIIGCIDGCYIPIRTPAHKIRSTYVNRHDQTALTLQGICDAQMKFLDCFTGISSKIHDSRVYDLSFIKNKVSQMGDNYHIIGDAAYPISVNLLTPYRGQLNEVQRNFNKEFCRARVKIENSFGILQNRFRQLIRLDMWSVSAMSNFIISCCVLHNICIEKGDVLIDREYIEITLNEEAPNLSDNRRRQLGQMKRDRMAVDLM